MKWLPWILVVLLSVTLLCTVHNRKDDDKVDRDTTTFVDTILFYKLVPRDSIVVRYETVKLTIRKDTSLNNTPSVDSICDSVDVVIPITQKEYATDTFRAWVSGYHSSLDSIRIYLPTRVITTRERSKRWGVGIHTGIGVCIDGIVPYIGIGISYDLWRW